MPERLLVVGADAAGIAPVGVRLAGRAPESTSDANASPGLARVEVGPVRTVSPARPESTVARAFALEPEVLLLDEPFGALDALTRMSLQDQLLEVWDSQRRTVVMVTHDVDEALLLSDRVVVMSHGPAARIKEEFAVPFSRPRHRIELARTPEFNDLRAALLQSLTAELVNA